MTLDTDDFLNTSPCIEYVTSRYLLSNTLLMLNNAKGCALYEVVLAGPWNWDSQESDEMGQGELPQNLLQKGGYIFVFSGNEQEHFTLLNCVETIGQF